MTLKERHLRIILTLVMFTAGVSFLVYEVVWDRMLSLYLGVTVHASTIVVSAYMAGMAAGAYFIGRYAGRKENAGTILAALLLLSGIVNAGVYYMLLLVPAIPGVVAQYAYSLSVVFVSAFLTGGAMPVVSRMFKDIGSSSAASIGGTFAADTFGSATGGILAGFFLLGFAGMKSSVLIMSAAVIMIAFAVMIVFRKTVPTARPNVRTEKVRAGGREPRISRSSLFTAVFVTGLTGLAAQILWMRIFRIYLTNTSYTFSLIVSVVIFGYFAGSMIFGKFIGRKRDEEKIFLISFFAYAIAFLWSVLVFVNAPDHIIYPLHESLSSPAARILLPPVILSLLTVFPQSVLSGFIFTSAIKMYNDVLDNISEGFGKMYFFNTLGAFAGPFAAAFLLIPYAGVVRSIVICSFIGISSAYYISIRHSLLKGKASAVFLPSAAVAAALLIVPQIKVMPPSFSRADRDILFYKETTEATLVVGRDRSSGLKYTYFNNSSVIGSSYDALKAVKLLGHLPFLLVPEPEKVLIVGFGIGVTTSTVLMHPEVKSVTCVELADELKEAAVLYSDLNNRVTEDPRLEIIGNDGRRFLFATEEKYDMISSDPTHPVLGSGNLYSKEYFQLCFDHLTDDGIVTQYLPMHKLKAEDYAGIIRTFNSVFEYTTVWLGHTHTILAGTKKKISLDFDRFSEKAKNIKDQYLYSDPYSLASHLILDYSAAGRFSENAIICTDDRSYLDFFEFDSFLPGNWSVNADRLLEFAGAEGIFYNIDDTERMRRFRMSSRLVTEGLIRSMRGDKRGYINKLYEANAVNPENQEIIFLIRLEGMSAN